MVRYVTRKVYEERLNNYIRNLHINQLRDLGEDGAMASIVAAPIPVSKDRLKNKSKRRQEAASPAAIAPAPELVVSESGAAVRVLRPAWKVNTHYNPKPGYRLRLSMFDKAYERDSM